jgi:hypothetical protein
MGVAGESPPRIRVGVVTLGWVAMLLAGLAVLTPPAARAAPGDQLWVSRYEAAGGGGATDLGVSPDASKVFVTGTTLSNVWEYTTVACDALSGAMLWGKHYNGSRDELDVAAALGVSPDGSEVFVTGSSPGLATEGYATVAYSMR